MSWLDSRHTDYQKLKRRAEFAQLYRTGEVQQRAENQARHVTRQATGIRFQGNRKRWAQYSSDMHLLQRSQGETIDAYIERVMVSRYPRHFARIVTSFIGSIMQVEEEKTTMWGPEGEEGLGDPNEAGTILNGYWNDIDGKGTSWPMMIVDVLDMLITTHAQWYYLDPYRQANGQARLHLLKQEDVLNWKMRDGRLVEMLISEGTPSAASIKQEDSGSDVERFLFLTLDGWERWEKDDEGGTRMINEGEWRFPFWRHPDRRTVDGVSRRLPVGYQIINLSEPVGYNTALDARYLYNLLSDIRWAMRTTSYAKLAPEEMMSADEHEQAVDALAKGHNLLTFPANFIGPDSSVFEKEYAIFKDEVRDFYVTALQSYEDAAKEVTATEKRQEQQAGRYSFLSVLAASIDEFANDVLYLVEQVERPEDPGLWRTHHVQRTRQFEPVDPAVRGQQLADRYFGRGVVPVGETGKVDAAKDIAQADGIQFDEDELIEDVREQEARAAQAQDAGALF